MAVDGKVDGQARKRNGDRWRSKWQSKWRSRLSLPPEGLSPKAQVVAPASATIGGMHPASPSRRTKPKGPGELPHPTRAHGDVHPAPLCPSPKAQVSCPIQRKPTMACIQSLPPEGLTRSQVSCPIQRKLTVTSNLGLPPEGLKPEGSGGCPIQRKPTVASIQPAVLVLWVSWRCAWPPSRNLRD
jgi:hypothetical protein